MKKVGLSQQKQMKEFAMSRRRFIKNISAGIAGLTLGGTPLDLPANDDFVTVSILHTNDIHSHIEPFNGSNPKYDGKGGIVHISGLAREVRKKNPNTLLFDAGDMFQGTPYFNYFKGELMMKTMSAAGYDAGNIGNHEFDNGLQGILDPLQHAQFPLISSNYDFSETILAGKIQRWKIFDRSGIKIGIYGLGIELDGLVNRNHFGKTIYNDPLKTALEMEAFLKNEQNCDLVVCLSHLGLKYDDNQISDLLIAPETFHTDLIIGGHTHTFLEKPLSVKNKKGKEIVVNQAWWGGLVMGKIDFVFKRAGKNKISLFAEKLS